MDYSTYKTRVADEINEDNLDSNIADWINEARKQIADGTLPVPGVSQYDFSWLYDRDSITLTSGTNLYDQPSDTIKDLCLFYPTDEVPLVKIEDPARMDALMLGAGQNYADTGEPQNYGIFGQQYLIWPTPDSDYTIYYRHLAYPADLSADDDEETIDTVCPGLVISAASLLAARFLHDEKLIQQFTDDVGMRFRGEIVKDRRKKYGNVQLRIKTFRDYNLSHFRGRQT